MPPKPLLMLINGPSVSREVLQITSDGPIAFPRSFVDNIGWGPDMPPKPLLMLMNGPSVFSGSSAIHIGWAQCFPENFFQ
jgi:hypothetical protein